MDGLKTTENLRGLTKDADTLRKALEIVTNSNKRICIQSLTNFVKDAFFKFIEFKEDYGIVEYNFKSGGPKYQGLHKYGSSVSFEVYDN